MLMSSHRLVRAGQAQIIDVFGQREEILSDTPFSTIFINSLPQGVGVPMHVHPDMDESCLVLEGTIKFVADADEFIANKGDYVHVDRGVPHGFVATEGAKLLWVCTPGGYLGFFEELAMIPAGEGGPDFGALATVAAKYGIEVVGPPPSL